MTRWLKRMRGALLMGLTWAVVWAPIGVLIGLIVDADGSMDEPWPLIGAYPGFLSGVIFSIVLGIAARRRRFEELSVPRFAAWGAAAGLLLGMLVRAAGSPSPGIPGWLPVVVTGAFGLLGAGSAAGTLALARRAERRLEAGAHADAATLTGGHPPKR